MNDQSISDLHWRSLRSLSIYRLLVSLILIIVFYRFRDTIQWEDFSPEIYKKFAASYLVFNLFAFVVCAFRKTFFKIKLISTTLSDIGFIVMIMHGAGGIKSGLGLLIVISITLASLVASGRLALLFAACATIAILLQQSLQLLITPETSAGYTHAIILSLSFFAISWLAYSFSKKSSASEALATQRKTDLENLSQVNALITQEMQDGVMVVDAAQIIRHQNAQALSLLHLQQPSAHGLNLQVISAELSSLLYSWVRQPAEDNSLFKLNIDDRELGIRFMPIDDERKNGAVIFIEDWSHAQIQAQQSKLAALGRLTASIAHEIRNPLSAISHANQLLNEDTALDAGSKRMLQIIGDNVQRLDQMVKDILELNRRDRTQQEKIHVQEFITDFHLQFCQVEHIEHEQFEISMPVEPIFIMFDRRHMHQTLWNLCRNGWRHSNQRENCLKIAVVERTTKTIKIEVIDDGSGVPAEIRPHIFEPFFTTESSGTGLGLYITRELCEANSAKIQYTYEKQHSIFSIQVKKV